MKRFTKLMSLAMAVVFAVSVFSITSEAKIDDALSHKRDLTTEEIQCLYTLFKADEYAKMYPDVAAELGTDETVLFNHFVSFGVWELRNPSTFFNVNVYASRNTDLQEAYGDDVVSYYVHYVQHCKTDTDRPLPTTMDAYYHGCTIYSVYDFVKGQVGPKAGAIPVQNRYYYPGIESVQ